MRNLWLSQKFATESFRNKEISFLKNLQGNEKKQFTQFTLDFVRSRPLCGYNTTNLDQDGFNDYITFHHYHIGDPNKSKPYNQNLPCWSDCPPCTLFSENLSSSKKSAYVIHYLKNTNHPNDIFVIAYGLKHIPFPKNIDLKEILGTSYEISNFKQMGS